ncbi:SRPBCC family protein [Nocardioides plantarum]|uniref:SRPBCC family protein n=1 Tax=Nocardioides plantarum TaxID=29299 RepID=A0ABV5KC94_9ACTN|nr:SRPBCC family protein [Nocardioides plantarum]
MATAPSGSRTSKNRSATTTIAAPAAVVFAILADPRQHARIDGSGNVRDAVDGPERLVLGSRFAMGMKKGASYQTKNTVVEYDADRLIAWRHVGLHRWRYELAPTADGGTEVTETWDLSHYPAPGRLALSALFGTATQQAVEATLVKLKAAAEADAARS